MKACRWKTEKFSSQLCGSSSWVVELCNWQRHIFSLILSSFVFRSSHADLLNTVFCVKLKARRANDGKLSLLLRFCSCARDKNIILIIMSPWMDSTFTEVHVTFSAACCNFWCDIMRRQKRQAEWKRQMALLSFKWGERGTMNWRTELDPSPGKNLTFLEEREGKSFQWQN